MRSQSVSVLMVEALCVEGMTTCIDAFFVWDVSVEK